MHTTLNEVIVQLKLENSNYNPNMNVVISALKTKGLSL